MREFKNYHYDLIKNYINSDEELFQKLATAEIHNILADEELNNPNMTNQEKREFILQQIATNKDILVRIYVLKKIKGELNDLFPNFIYNIFDDSECPEIKCMSAYQASFYERTFVEKKESAIAEYITLMENNEVWKLFEDENYPDFLMPNSAGTDV
ncbi:hypothetical protein [Leeuwenhoekiella parthenopeia]|uniref:Uncharacterized protein n=1 Tax=Leeuwenhoekiella parthenopeia TaxID=2890320 RepID=A0ABS8GWF8_9FLAO|nr:hypothetical protein [Leeuwenhoekiella parthenopeia]MCC4214098.1 hypothetical protein [Leeuwenhoekiella parthenopeia]